MAAIGVLKASIRGDVYSGLKNLNRVPFKGFYKGSIVGFYSIGALIIRIGFWGPLYFYTHNEDPPKWI